MRNGDQVTQTGSEGRLATFVGTDHDPGLSIFRGTEHSWQAGEHNNSIICRFWHQRDDHMLKLDGILRELRSCLVCEASQPHLHA